MEFSFDNCLRNETLIGKGYKAPKTLQTGTTIVGLIYKDGVILGADTRATGGPVVFDKNCQKIHYISQFIYCCGAGTAADTEMTTRMISSQLELYRLNNSTNPTVVQACTLLKRYLFQYGGYVGAYLVLGGIDKTGPSLYQIHAHGSSDRLPFTTMGSGSLAAMGVLETRWKQDLEEKEAIDIVANAIQAGIFNDLGSGSNVDIAVINNNPTLLRNYQRPVPESEKIEYPIKIGTTEYISEKRIDLKNK